MNVKEIVAEWLKGHKFDGLCCEDCGCGVTDLMCCGGDGIEFCVPAYKRLATQADIEGENGMDVEVGDTIYVAEEKR